ncbi:serine/threonine-protein kinase pakD isoform X2 [Leptidea sinapis]|uniref:serine/threonine-protein kinase pakD isoform X2 n=1 Tax=Leptidea sinapis TaxID=189913 RepID=UPI002120C358|nr:serine/threonine-protein kinase pakD isoform X2 [Leptidea sinapis]
MSVLNQSGEEQVECPLCMEPLEVDDLHFYPCTCGYQICRFCWNRIREGENGLCPACRKAYPENPADFTPLSQEQVAAIKTEKKAREQKRRNKTLESRRALANVRVVQNNLVFVVGLPVRLADPEILKRQEYFGKYGKIHKVVINQSPAYAGSQCVRQSPSASAYVTYVSSADALRAIQAVNNVTLDGRVLKGSLGTTKYCANFMKNQPCPKADCMYLHELGDPKASFTKEEMHAGLHQVYERRLHQQLINSTKDRIGTDDKLGSSSSSNTEKSSSKDGSQSNFIPTTIVTASQINSVSTSKSKRDSVNGITNGSSNSNGNGKEAWPSLGSSPPNDSPARKHNTASPKPHNSSVKSQENGTSEPSSPTNVHSQPQPQCKDHHTDKASRKDTNDQKKNKSDKAKQKISTDEEDIETFEMDTQYLTNELDELESDRHSLLENHDLLNNSDHSLLDDDNSHDLLNDVNNEVLMMQRHREMLAGLVENNITPHNMKSSLTNGYGLLDRETMSYLGNDRQSNQMNQTMMDQKDIIQSQMLQRQNELLARQQSVMEPKHYLQSSVALESASELLGANYHPNVNILPPFGMRVDNLMTSNSMGNTISGNSLANSLSTNSLSSNPLSPSPLSANPLSPNPLPSNTLSLNSLGANSLSNNMVNPLGPNAMVANSIQVNNMSVNTLGGNLGANNLNSYILHNHQLHMQNQQMQNQQMQTQQIQNQQMQNQQMQNHQMQSQQMQNQQMQSQQIQNHQMQSQQMQNHQMQSHQMQNHRMQNHQLQNHQMQNQQMHSQQIQNQQMQSQHIKNHQLQNQQMHGALMNGFDSPHSISEGRYQADNMEKFFTDFHKAQQMRMVSRSLASNVSERGRYPHNMLSAERLEMEHKQRMNSMRVSEMPSGRAAGDADDDLDFDPFKETQKALAEMMETEMMLNNISSGDNVRPRPPPPGFSHATLYQRQQPQQQDWTQMDPAIMSTSVNFGKNPAAINHQEIFTRFNQLHIQPNGVKLQLPPAPQWAAPHKVTWGAAPYNSIPMPPGFSPQKPPQHPAECIDAK